MSVLTLGKKEEKKEDIPELSGDAAEIKAYMDFYEKVKTYKINISWEYCLNLANYFGFQAMWDDYAHKLVDCHDYPVWINILYQNINNRISRIVSRSPKWEVEPDFSINSYDEQNARVTQKIIEHFEKNKNLKGLRRKTQIWTHLCASCFQEIYFDKFSGNKKTLAYMSRDTDEIQYDYIDNADEIIESEGDVEIELWNWFEVFYDINIKNFKQANRVMLIRDIPNDKIKEKFGNKILEKINKYKENNKSENKDDIVNVNFSGDYLINTYVGLNNTESEKTAETTRVYKIYENPSQKYREGRLLYIINGEYVYKGINPSPDNKIPIIHRFNIDTPNSIEKKALTSDLRKLQEEYNSIRSQMKRTRENSGNLTAITDDDSNIRFEQMDGYPGTVIRAPFDIITGKPKVSIEAPIRADMGYLLEQLNCVKDDIQNIVSLRVSSDRSFIAQRMSGVAMDKLNVVDNDDLAWEISTIEDQEIEVMKLFITCAQKNYSEDKLKQIIGDTYVIGFKNIKDLITNKINIRPFSMMPSDISSKRQYFLQLAQVNPAFLQTIPFHQLAKELEFGGFEDLYARMEKSQAKAMEENRTMMMTGQMVDVDLMKDKHDIEIQVHEDFILTKEYKNIIKFLIKKGNILYAKNFEEIINQHILQHYQAIESRKQMEMQSQIQNNQQPQIAAAG